MWSEATRTDSIDQTVGVAAYWRLSGNRRLTPHLLLGMGLWRLADRPCVAEGAPPVVGTPQPGQRFRVDFAGGRPCAGKPFDTSFRIWPQVGRIAVKVINRLGGEVTKEFRA